MKLPVINLKLNENMDSIQTFEIETERQFQSDVSGTEIFREFPKIKEFNRVLFHASHHPHYKSLADLDNLPNLDVLANYY